MRTRFHRVAYVLLFGGWLLMAGTLYAVPEPTPSEPSAQTEQSTEEEPAMSFDDDPILAPLQQDEGVEGGGALVRGCCDIFGDNDCWCVFGNSNGCAPYGQCPGFFCSPC